MGMMCNTITNEEIPKYSDGSWIAEKKYDGSRVRYAYGKIFTQDRFSFRDSRDVTWKFPELEHKQIDAVLDGELVAESGSFEDTGSRVHLQDKLLIKISAKKNPVIFWVFDIMEVKGEDVSRLPLSTRKELLKSITFDNPRFKLVESTTDIQGLWDKVVEEQGEGIVLKRINSPYEYRRSQNWIKCKNFKEEIFVAEKYDENPKGIALYLVNGQRVQCSGDQSGEVKHAIDTQGSVRVEIQYLTKDAKAGGKEGEWVLRFPSFKGLVA